MIFPQDELTWGWGVPGTEPKMEAAVFYNLILKVTQHPYGHILSSHRPAPPQCGGA